MMEGIVTVATVTQRLILEEPGHVLYLTFALFYLIIIPLTKSRY